MCITWFTKSYGLHPSHNALWVPTLLGLLHPFSYIYTRFAPAAGLISTGILMNDRKKKLKTWEYNQT